MKFIDWFAGVGGFRKGMEEAGHECVGFCEFDKFAVASYTSMHLITDEQREYLATLDLKKRQKEILKEEYRNGEWFANDIRRVYAGDIPESDCWCFGFPCQDISVAGKQCGFKGNRSSLFFRVMYILGQLPEEKRPDFLFIENVKNLLSVNGGWDFARLLIEMDKVGYDAEWTVLNSKNFGVPQNRERCFIIGHLRGRGSAEVFPVEGTDGADSVHGIGHRDGYRRNTQIFDQDGITEALDTGQGGGRGHHTVIPVGNTNPSGNGINGNCYFSEALNPTLTTNKGEGNKVAIPVEDIQTKPGFNQRNIVHDVNGIARTVMGSGHTGNEPKVAIPINSKGYDRIAQIPYENGKMSGRTGIYSVDSGVPAETATQAKDPYRVAIPVLTPDRTNKRQNGRRFKEDGEESFTLTGQDRHGVAVAVDAFAIDKGIQPEERTEANCLTAREDRGLSRHKQEGTLICKILESCVPSVQNTENESEKTMKPED